MDVLQCPHCSLKFRLAAELEQHISLEHPERREDADDVSERVAARQRRLNRGQGT